MKVPQFGRAKGIHSIQHVFIFVSHISTPKLVLGVEPGNEAKTSLFHAVFLTAWLATMWYSSREAIIVHSCIYRLLSGSLNGSGVLEN